MGSFEKKYFLLFALAVFVFNLSSCNLMSNFKAKEEFEKARTLLAKGEFASSASSFKTVVALYPETEFAPESQYMSAKIKKEHLKDYKGARDDFNGLFNLYPDSSFAALARVHIAQLASLEGRRLKAIELYEKILEDLNYKGSEESLLKDDYDTLKIAIAFEYKNLRNFRQARIELEDILRVTPGTEYRVKIFFEIGNAYYVEGDLKGAMKAYNRIIKEFPNHKLLKEAKLAKAVIYEETDRLEEALELLNELEGSYPNAGVIEVRKSWVLKRIKETPREVIEKARAKREKERALAKKAEKKAEEERKKKYKAKKKKAKKKAKKKVTTKEIKKETIKKNTSTSSTKAEPKKTEPKKTEPKKTEPKKTELKKIEVKKDEAKTAEPEKDAMKAVEPAKLKIDTEEKIEEVEVKEEEEKVN